jgi:small subunit ribosomal protein S20
MANTSSAKKAIRVIARKTKVNSTIKKNYKAARKVVSDAIAKKDKNAALKAFPEAMKKIDKAAKNSVIHAKTAARYKSRLAKSINKLG